MQLQNHLIDVITKRFVPIHSFILPDPMQQNTTSHSIWIVAILSIIYILLNWT